MFELENRSHKVCSCSLSQGCGTRDSMCVREKREGEEERETMKKNKLNLPPNFKNKEIKEQERVISEANFLFLEREKGRKDQQQQKVKTINKSFFFVFISSFSILSLFILSFSV